MHKLHKFVRKNLKPQSFIVCIVFDIKSQEINKFQSTKNKTMANDMVSRRETFHYQTTKNI